jgi:hypothetical protein
MVDHSDYKFSVTLHSNDLAVVNCLRSLADFSQKEGNKRIAWGGTKDTDWKRDRNRVTFRFTTSQYRDGFKEEVERLLPRDLWTITGTRDDDPAQPQR